VTKSLFLIFALFIAALGQPVGTLVHRFQADMTRPTDVAVLNDGRICVADGVNSRVIVFSPAGTHQALRFAELQRPLGLAGDIAGGLLITDTQAHAVLILNDRLRLTARIQLPDTVDPTDVYPVGDQLWVVNNDGHQILVVDRAGQVTQTIGKKGIDGATFSYPATLSGDQLHKLYVCDVLNARIQLFDDQGEYLGQIGDMGVTPGTFYRPKGVAVTPAGAFIVTDSFTGVLHYFSDPTATDAVLKTEAGAYLRLKNPLGVCWDSSGLLWVVESGTGDLLGIRVK